MFQSLVSRGLFYRWQQRAINIACQNGHLGLVRSFLTTGEKTSDIDYTPAFKAAVAAGDFKLLADLIERCPQQFIALRKVLLLIVSKKNMSEITEWLSKDMFEEAIAHKKQPIYQKQNNQMKRIAMNCKNIFLLALMISAPMLYAMDAVKSLESEEVQTAEHATVESIDDMSHATEIDRMLRGTLGDGLKESVGFFGGYSRSPLKSGTLRESAAAYVKEETLFQDKFVPILERLKGMKSREDLNGDAKQIKEAICLFYRTIKKENDYCIDEMDEATFSPYLAVISEKSDLVATEELTKLLPNCFVQVMSILARQGNSEMLSRCLRITVSDAITSSYGRASLRDLIAVGEIFAADYLIDAVYQDPRQFIADIRDLRNSNKSDLKTPMELLLDRKVGVAIKKWLRESSKLAECNQICKAVYGSGALEGDRLFDLPFEGFKIVLLARFTPELPSLSSFIAVKYYAIMALLHSASLSVSIRGDEPANRDARSLAGFLFVRFRSQEAGRVHASADNCLFWMLELLDQDADCGLSACELMTERPKLAPFIKHLQEHAYVLDLVDSKSNGGKYFRAE